MFTLIVHNKRELDSSILSNHEYVQTISAIPQLKHIANELILNKPVNTYGLHPIIQLYFAIFDTRLLQTTPPEVIIYLKTHYNDLFRLLTEERIVKIPMVTEQCSLRNVTIPMYNMLHVGNICHLNTSLNILSSLIGYIYDLKDSSDPMVNILVETLISSFSEIDPTPNNIHMLISHLGIDMNQFEEADDTMKMLMKILYKQIGFDRILYWDSIDTFLNKDDKKLSFNQLVDKYKPRVLIVNNQDFCVVTDNDDGLRNVRRDYITEQGLKYTVSSCILHCISHFISVFRRFEEVQYNGGNIIVEHWIIRDDLMNKFNNTSQYNMKANRFPITVSCYIRVDEFVTGYV